MTGIAKIENVELNTIGYKYNKSKVLTFVFSKGVGSTEKGKPYEANFPDQFGNICVQPVERLK